MELAKHRLVAPKDNRPVKIFAFGDIHLGAAACDLHDAERLRDQIAADPASYWVGLGDYADAILPSDPRWSYRNLDWKNIGRDAQGLPDVGDLAQAQIDMVDAFFKPIWGQCLGLLTGNHEETMKKHYFVDLTQRLAKKYNVPYLGYTALMRLEFKIDRGQSGHHEIFKADVFLEHGATGGGTLGNSINDLSKRLSQFDAAVFLKGHIHKRAIAKQVRFGWSAEKLTTQHRVMALTGTFLRSYQEGELTYGERAAYAPGEIGGICVLVSPRTGKIDAVNAETLGMFT